MVRRAAAVVGCHVVVGESPVLTSVVTWTVMMTVAVTLRLREPAAVAAVLLTAASQVRLSKLTAHIKYLLVCCACAALLVLSFVQVCTKISMCDRVNALVSQAAITLLLWMQSQL
jgi:hypothetical protein